MIQFGVPVILPPKNLLLIKEKILISKSVAAQINNNNNSVSSLGKSPVSDFNNHAWKNIDNNMLGVVDVGLNLNGAFNKGIYSNPSYVNFNTNNNNNWSRNNNNNNNNNNLIYEKKIGVEMIRIKVRGVFGYEVMVIIGGGQMQWWRTGGDEVK
jgi:hypothetical protein